MALLERTHREHPADRDVLLALTLVVRDHGDLAAALTHAQGLAGLGPPDPQVRAPIEDLRRRLRRYDLSLELARTVKATEIRPSVCRLPHLANPGSALLARNLRLLSGPGPCISPAGREGTYSPPGCARILPAQIMATGPVPRAGAPDNWRTIRYAAKL